MDVFLHIPKASGTTIRTVLSREYGASKIAYYEPETEHSEHYASPETYLTSRLAKGDVRLITGHLRYGIHEFLRHPCRYFSMLRDPIDRAISEYFYAFSYPLHRYRDLIVSGKMSFVDFIETEPETIGSTITHFLAGWSKGLHSPYEVALHQLRHGIVTVGTSERFDESILLMAKRLGWKPPLYCPRNVTKLDGPAQHQRQQSRNEANLLLRPRFAGDYQVYDAADALISKQVLSLGPKFRRALEDYIELQKALAELDNPLIFDEYNLEQDDELPAAAAHLYESTPYRRLRDYLLSDPSPRNERQNLIGYFDGRTSSDLTGWAMDLSRKTPITVTLRRHDQVLDTRLCDIARPDVVAAGFPETPCGFHFPLNPPVGDLSGFSICFGDSFVQLGT